MSKSEICQSCKKQFVIGADDLEFYNELRVPPPTWCPTCRMQRRSSFLTAKSLFRRKENLNNTETLSVYPPEAPFPIYKDRVWWSDEWDPFSYGRDFDPGKPFLKQVKELLDSVPRPDIVNLNSVNCEYCPGITNSKNSYYTVGFEADNCLYGYYTRSANDCVDYTFLINSDRCYECSYCRSCSNISFSDHSTACRDSAFLYDCKNCSDCFGCTGLRNKQYHMFNQPLTKEEYEKSLSDLGSYNNLQEASRKFSRLLMEFPHVYARIHHSENVTGDNIRNSKNCRMCFDIDPLQSSTENCKWIVSATAVKDSYDLFDTGEGTEHCFEGISCSGFNNFFSMFVIESHHVEYSHNCFNSHHLFGCAGLRNKQYCILNKQYTKEQYEKLVPEIRNHMDKVSYKDQKGRVYKYGEFFPPEFSPLGYNHSAAQERFPLLKEEALDRGFSWKDQESRDLSVDIRSEDIPDHIQDADDSVSDKVFECAHKGSCKFHACTGAFRIIPRELEFYRRQNLPLPRLCPNCRHFMRLEKRNPLKLWERQCMCDYKAYKNSISHNHHLEGRCPRTFETPYDPEDKRIVYCEDCYNAEVV